MSASSPHTTPDQTLEDSLRWLKTPEKHPPMARLFAQRLIDHMDGQARQITHLEEQLEAQVAAGHECREHYMRLEEQLEAAEIALREIAAMRIGETLAAKRARSYFQEQDLHKERP